MHRTDLKSTQSDATLLYGISCNWCKNSESNGYCGLKHRQKIITITDGPDPELIYRKVNGCSDHKHLSETDQPRALEVEPLNHMFRNSK